MTQPDAGAPTVSVVGSVVGSVSVVVVSRHRPAALSLCLTALTLQDHPGFEIVLVADPGSVGVRPDLPIKRVRFDAANISAARNAGVMAAAGEVVAFIDDDAVAEPTWLSRLTAPFADPAVPAATGATRGRDGLRWQVRAERMTGDGLAVPVQPWGDSVRLLAPEGGRPVGTLGTNCAFRRDALVELGGFDPAFAYHLDESDLNMRMAARWPDAPTAVVPMAEVAHGWAGDDRRSASGVPADLTQIGRSTAIFCDRHGGDSAKASERVRTRLLRLMVAGRLDPLRVAPLMATFHAGVTRAPRSVCWPKPLSDAPPPPFLTLPGTGPRAHSLLTGWHWQRRRLRADAARLSGKGRLVTLVLFSPSILRHRTRFDPAGFWEQAGGLWGPSFPGDPAVRAWRFRVRAAREAQRLARTRSLQKLDEIGGV